MVDRLPVDRQQCVGARSRARYRVCQDSSTGGAAVRSVRRSATRQVAERVARELTGGRLEAIGVGARRLRQPIQRILFEREGSDGRSEEGHPIAAPKRIVRDHGLVADGRLEVTKWIDLLDGGA